MHIYSHISIYAHTYINVCMCVYVDWIFWQNVCVPLHSNVEIKPPVWWHLKVGSLRGNQVWVWHRHGISALTKQGERAGSFLLHTVRTQQEVSLLPTALKRLSLVPNHPGNVILNFQPPELGEINVCWLSHLSMAIYYSKPNCLSHIHTHTHIHIHMHACTHTHAYIHIYIF